MPSRKFKTWQLLAILLLSIILPMATIITFAQNKNSISESKAVVETCRGSHTRKDFYKNVRHLEPANVLEIVGMRVNYVTASEGIELGSLEIEVDWTKLPKDFGPRNHAGCYGIIFCAKHLVALEVEVLDPKFCPTIKN